MKKICLIILCFALCFLCCCNKQPNTNNVDDGKPTIVMPDYNTQITVNGYKMPDSDQNTAEEPKEELYYTNKSSKKFHKSDCGYAKSIKEENLYITNNLTELIDGGYQACKQCKP